VLALRDQRRRDDRGIAVVFRCRPPSNSFFWNAWPRRPGAPFDCDVDRRHIP